eukprot:CAMPEP_0203901118 /NCGR_PEP_ID=MMETSP0359-20131031/43334_1 /ASSEMBLY_ACC=CAM_ASM_000338 /TAXON_ID=268821 /ORGANISM="Scrippsiella Hangoei, Strain SHTV-5" /LENGTH=147 /DNA_ID=CAMNT_0050824725 /DNA_START=74 /DNA_END=518 /DNA_ORIENTATION=-
MTVLTGCRPAAVKHHAEQKTISTNSHPAHEPPAPEHPAWHRRCRTTRGCTRRRLTELRVPEEDHMLMIPNAQTMQVAQRRGSMQAQALRVANGPISKSVMARVGLTRDPDHIKHGVHQNQKPQTQSHHVIKSKTAGAVSQHNTLYNS